MLGDLRRITKSPHVFQHVLCQRSRAISRASARLGALNSRCAPHRSAKITFQWNTATDEATWSNCNGHSPLKCWWLSILIFSNPGFWRDFCFTIFTSWKVQLATTCHSCLASCRLFQVLLEPRALLTDTACRRGRRRTIGAALSSTWNLHNSMDLTRVTKSVNALRCFCFTFSHTESLWRSDIVCCLSFMVTDVTVVQVLNKYCILVPVYMIFICFYEYVPRKFRKSKSQVPSGK